MFGQPCLRGSQQSFPFGGGECFKGALHAAFRAGFHFHENKGVALFGHDVQFQMSAAPVARQNSPTHGAKRGRGRVFSLGSRFFRGGFAAGVVSVVLFAA